jgi:hypothetical protein
MILLLFWERLSPKVRSPFFFSLQDQGVTDQLMDTSHLYPWSPIGKQGRQGGFVNRADAGQEVDTMLLLDIPDGVGSWESTP